jgi:predicted DNA-binding mobile mystery protein A
MKTKITNLLLEQLDKKLNSSSVPPPTGWIYAIRTALRMSRRQLGKRLGITAQGVKDIEAKEAAGTISLNRLKTAAQALNMNFIYSLKSRDGSLAAMLNKAAHKAAVRIVAGAAATMRLENQGNSARRLKKAVQQKAAEIRREMPKYLWE